MKKSARKAFAVRTVTAAVCVAFSGLTQANPTGPTVVSGQATFNTQQRTLTVTNSPGAIINWQGFSIARDELTRFLQQSSVSAVLNRVLGGNPSEILGRLASNGRVVLINPSGITFGAGAQIDVAGLVASSLHLSDSDFIAGRLRFSANGNEGRVLNQGEIVTPVGGRVVLIGPQVENSGLIRAPSGDIVLAAGSTVRLVDEGFPAIQVEVSAPKDRPLPLGALSPSGNVFAYLVKHAGTLSASAAAMGDGGRVALRSAGDIQALAGSVIEAGGQAGGKIEIAALATTRLEGALSAPASEGIGGSVRVAAQAIEIASGAKLDVSGSRGGGEVLAGAAAPDMAAAAAKTVTMDQGAEILANALHQGDGGRVELIAEQGAVFAGAIEARGGALAGDGGSVEVSGRQALAFTGTVDTRAPAGKDGSLLIDPNRIAIVPADTGIPAALADASWTSAEDPGVQPLGASNLGALLATTSVSLQASERIELTAGTQVNVAPAAARTLSLAAPQILIHGTFRSTGAPLNLNLNAGSVRIAQGAELALAGGSLTVSATEVTSSQPLLNTRDTQHGLVRAVNSDLAALRAQVEAEIARDNARVAQSMKSCGKLADTRQGCMVSTPAPRRFFFAGA